MQQSYALFLCVITKIVLHQQSMHHPSSNALLFLQAVNSVLPAIVMVSLLSEDGVDEAKVQDVLKFRPRQKSKFPIASWNMPNVNSTFERPSLWTEISDRKYSYSSMHSVFRSYTEERNNIHSAFQPQYFVCITVCTWLMASWFLKEYFSQKNKM